MSKSSSAPMSLCAPRDTHDRSSATSTVSDASTETAVAGFAAGIPFILTRPAPHQLGVNTSAPRHGASAVRCFRRRRPLFDRLQRLNQEVVRLLQPGGDA